MSELRVSVSGFRGIVGDSLTAPKVTRLAAAYASLLGDGPLVVGRDSRPSGPALLLAVEAGLLAVGREVIDLGIVPTPTVGLYTKHRNAAGGIVITASHNPIEWNALKFFGPDGLFAPEDRVFAVADREASNAIPWAVATAMGSVREANDAIQVHMDRILRTVDRAVTRAAKIRVVVDGCRGAGSVLVPALLRELGCEVIELDCVPDGWFTRQPEPTPAALAGLAEAVRREKAAVGFALDPDADRLALVDDQGTALSEELTLVLAADFVLENCKGPLVSNLSSTGLLDRVAERHGVPMFRSKIGEAHVTALILSSGAPVGGEGNGGVIVPSIVPGRDAATGAALIVERLAREAKPLSGIVAGYPPVAMVKDKVSVEGLDVADLLVRMRALFADARFTDMDGLRADWPDRWIHVRPSNTESILRMIAEGPTEAAARAIVDRFRAAILG